MKKLLFLILILILQSCVWIDETPCKKRNIYIIPEVIPISEMYTKPEIFYEDFYLNGTYYLSKIALEDPFPVKGSDTIDVFISNIKVNNYIFESENPPELYALTIKNLIPKSLNYDSEGNYYLHKIMEPQSFWYTIILNIENPHIKCDSITISGLSYKRDLYNGYSLNETKDLTLHLENFKVSFLSFGPPSESTWATHQELPIKFKLDKEICVLAHFPDCGGTITINIKEDDPQHEFIITVDDWDEHDNQIW